MNADREWTVLFLGGPSGTGKSSVAYALARHYGINVLEIDDIVEALKAMAGKDVFPALHHWSGADWMDVGIAGNVEWLVSVGREIAPAIRAVVENHLEGDVPVIIEGDFLAPAFACSFNSPKVKALFIHEPEEGQIVENYLAREGGPAQTYRAAISAAYGQWIKDECEKLGIPLLESRPWDTTVERAFGCL